MLAMSRNKREQEFGEFIGALGIVPVTISYELDPCDGLKANELHQLATHGPITSASVIGYEKPPAVAYNRSTVGGSSRGASKTEEEATTVEIIGDGGTQVDRFDEDGNRVDEKAKRSRNR